MKSKYDKIKTLIAQSEINRAIKELRLIIEENSQIELTTIKHRYEALQKKIRQGTLSHNEKTTTENQIATSLLSFVEMLEYGSIRQDSTENPINSATKTHLLLRKVGTLVLFVIFGVIIGQIITNFYSEKKEAVSPSTENEDLGKEEHNAKDTFINNTSDKTNKDYKPTDNPDKIDKSPVPNSEPEAKLYPIKVSHFSASHLKVNGQKASFGKYGQTYIELPEGFHEFILLKSNEEPMEVFNIKIDSKTKEIRLNGEYPQIKKTN